MSRLTFSIVFEKNKGSVLSSDELIELYLFGIPIQNRAGGTLGKSTISSYIKFAQEEVENWLGIKFWKQVIEEDRDFMMDDFKNWGYVRVSFPVLKAFQLNGFINSVRQIEYPPEWLSVRKTSDNVFYRHIYIVPQHTLQGTVNSVIYSGVTPHLGFLGQSTIPNYWSVRYCTGFKKIPSELLNFVGKLAALNVFRIAGDLILGAGISSKSLGIDGLSQSISTPIGGANSAFGARIEGYLKDLAAVQDRLYNTYKGFTVLSF